MTTRTTETTVTFRRFHAGGARGAQPAGTYRVETDEERLEGLSFDAFQGSRRCCIFRDVCVRGRRQVSPSIPPSSPPPGADGKD